MLNIIYILVSICFFMLIKLNIFLDIITQKYIHTYIKALWIIFMFTLYPDTKLSLAYDNVFHISSWITWENHPCLLKKQNNYSKYIKADIFKTKKNMQNVFFPDDLWKISNTGKRRPYTLVADRLQKILPFYLKGSA